MTLARRAHTRPATQWGDVDPGPGIARVLLDVELLLRRYGIHTHSPFTLEEAGGELCARWYEQPLRLTGAERRAIREMAGFSGGRMELEGVNIQFADPIGDRPPEAHLVDFGGYFVAGRFDSPIFVSHVAKYARLVGEVVRTDDPRFVQPVEGCRIPERAEALPPLLRDRFAAGRLDGAGVRREIDAFVRRAAAAIRADGHRHRPYFHATGPAR